MRHFNDALVIRATKPPSLAKGLVSAIATGGGVAILLLRFVPLPVLLVLAVMAAALGYVAGMRPRSTEPRVTNLEYVSRTFPTAFHSTRSLCRADGLEYQDDTSGPESEHPGGLYAVLKRRSVSILPHVDAGQSAAVVEAILTKFPDFRAQWRDASGFGSHITALGLDRTSQK